MVISFNDLASKSISLPYFRRIYIASSFTYADLFPWGSHPILDPLWSTEALEFIHDGCEATRVKKVALIAKSDVALKHLRVCYKNPNSSYNCGVCEKCIRTMINLKVNDALTNCDTFDHELTLKNVMKIIAKDNIARAFIKENLEALENSQGDGELHNALTKVLNRPLWPYKLKKRIKKSRKYLKKRFFRSGNL